jgi:hypothetical protein
MSRLHYRALSIVHVLSSVFDMAELNVFSLVMLLTQSTSLDRAARVIAAGTFSLFISLHNLASLLALAVVCLTLYWIIFRLFTIDSCSPSAQAIV